MNWNVLNWNIRGLNDDNKCFAVRQKIEESCCSVFCIQETKLETVTALHLKKLAPKRFSNFAFSPSIGASGGILIGWNESLFQGTIREINAFSVTVEFLFRLSVEGWILFAIYGPCHGPDRVVFIRWLSNLCISPGDNCMLIGDFNFFRSADDRNKLGGNVSDMTL
jgi:exonuclease III